MINSYKNGVYALSIPFENAQEYKVYWFWGKSNEPTLHTIIIWRVGPYKVSGSKSKYTGPGFLIYKHEMQCVYHNRVDWSNSDFKAKNFPTVCPSCTKP